MKKVVIYTTSVCPYCLRAKALFERKGIKYEEINVENDNSLREKMILAAGGKKLFPRYLLRILVLVVATIYMRLKAKEN